MRSTVIIDLYTVYAIVLYIRAVWMSIDLACVYFIFSTMVAQLLLMSAHHFVCVAFVDDEIRECVFMSLDERFDPHLAQAENLTTLFVAVHDGVSS